MNTIATWRNNSLPCLAGMNACVKSILAASPSPTGFPPTSLLSRRIIEGWMLHEDGVLALASGEHNNASLIWLSRDGEEILACFSSELQEAAREYAVTPLGLALLVLAMGGADDSRLKKLLPALHKAGKELLLIAVCRLCG